MSDEDDSDDDLFAEFENDDGTELNVSANLLADVGQEQKTVHAGEADEGKVFWVAPAVHGLRNSDKVTAKESHWYLDNKFANEPDSLRVDFRRRRRRLSILARPTRGGMRHASGRGSRHGACIA